MAMITMTKNLANRVTMSKMMMKNMRYLGRDKQVVFNERYDKGQFAIDHETVLDELWRT